MATDFVARVGTVRSRVRKNLWAVAQQTAAASLAWLLAVQLSGELADDHRPFFAPIAAVVALNTTLGGRGLQAVRLLEGAAMGVIVGAVALAALESPTLALPVATFTAMVLAVCVGAARVTIAQAASGAILTVAIPYGGSGGPQRLMDAAIGVAVALVFSQVLFPTHPVRMLQRSEHTVVLTMRELLRRTATALCRAEDDHSEEGDGIGRAGPDSRVRDARMAVRDAVGDLDFARSAGRNIVRRTVWARLRDSARARAAADTLLEDAATASLLVATTAPTAPAAFRVALAPVLREITDVLAALEDDAHSPVGRAHVAERAQELHGSLSVADRQAHRDDPTTDAAIGAVHILLHGLQRLHPGVFPGGPDNTSPGATAASS